MLENIIVLASFIPIIIGMGGNIGTQSSTIIVRGMATGRITIGNEGIIILKAEPDTPIKFNSAISYITNVPVAK